MVDLVTMPRMSNRLQTVTVVVLNDRETFTDVSGCAIMVVPLDQYEKVVRGGGDARDFDPIVQIELDAFSKEQTDE